MMICLQINIPGVDYLFRFIFFFIFYFGVVWYTKYAKEVYEEVPMRFVKILFAMDDINYRMEAVRSYL